MAATVTLVAEKNLVRVPGVLALAAPELRGVAPPLLPAPLLLGRRPRREELRHGVVHLRGRGEERRGLPEVEVVGVLHRHLPRPLDADPGVERVHLIGWYAVAAAATAFRLAAAAAAAAASSAAQSASPSYLNSPFYINWPKLTNQ
eukprot:CAMPEP_0194683084 /NCGR_PEP_ID=MMETSP0295-20121207/13197_1 /TAXON_ID=39354 /ORGANISM="Heterosigma akashiwo, Strain CCMP2393" /LENGTH=145 /DNA_ID=CAMNT_0039569651 /DNA_START=765 /DNA_END=1203 /DNA_ORIENTATION=+